MGTLPLPWMGFLQDVGSGLQNLCRLNLPDAGCSGTSIPSCLPAQGFVRPHLRNQLLALDFWAVI
jgi:hypothetical protein